MESIASSPWAPSRASWTTVSSMPTARVCGCWRTTSCCADPGWSASVVVDVAADVHERLDRLADGCRRLAGVGEGVRAGLHDVLGACREDLGLDDARAAIVDRAEDGDGAPVLLRVADEQLSASRLGRVAHGATAAGVVDGAAAVVEA